MLGTKNVPPSPFHLSSTSAQPLPFVRHYDLSLRLFCPNMQKPPKKQQNKFGAFLKCGVDFALHINKHYVWQMVNSEIIVI